MQVGGSPCGDRRDSLVRFNTVVANVSDMIWLDESRSTEWFEGVVASFSVLGG